MEANSKAKMWTGRLLTALAALPFLLSCFMKLTKGAPVMEGFPHLGWPVELVIPLGVLEATCVVLYLFPPVSVLGAILLTGYLGGAIATHVRIGEPIYTHAIIGLLIWGGLYFREPRLRSLLPIRSKDMECERHVTIALPLETVFAYLKSLKNFQYWNPFIKKDAQVKIDYRGVDGACGFTAIWDGNREVGAGEQEITKIVEGQRIDFELRFKRPLKVTHHGYFATQPVGETQTRVSWGIKGKAPFPMSLIGYFIDCDKMLGKDFEAGLSDLKSRLEK